MKLPFCCIFKSKRSRKLMSFYDRGVERLNRFLDLEDLVDATTKLRIMLKFQNYDLKKFEEDLKYANLLSIDE